MRTNGKAEAQLIRIAVGALTVCCGCSRSHAQESVKKIARLTHPPLVEVSGIVRSSYPGVYWVHNDSGDHARLFAITLDGSPVVPNPFRKRQPNSEWGGIRLVDASHVDWEDITRHGNRLFIGDVGNNGNARRDLGVYELIEPNPNVAEQARAMRFLPVRYPDQSSYPGDVWEFDCEALFVDRGKLHFITKHRLPRAIIGFAYGTKLYRLDCEATDAVNVLTMVGRRDDLFAPTAADLSPDGTRLCVLTYNAVWIFERSEDGDNWLAGRASKLNLDRVRMGFNEAVTWENNDTLLIANEQRQLFRVSSAALSPVP